MSGRPAPIARLFGRRSAPRRRNAFVPTPLGPVALETRQLMSTATLSQGILTVTGTNNADVITVADSGANIVVDGKSIAKSSVSTIVVNGLGGKDTIVVASTKAATLNGGDGDDTLVAGSGRDVLNGGAGNNVYTGTIDADLIVDPKLTAGVKMIKAIMDKYQALGGSAGSMGQPTGSQMSGGDGSWIDFKGGRIAYSPSTGAHSVVGAILDKYNSLGGPAGALGFPVTDEANWVTSAWRVSQFKNGGIFWNNGTGALAFSGTIWQRYRNMGGPVGGLGLPHDAQQSMPTYDYCEFEGGTILAAKGGPAYIVKGAILDKYYSLQGWFGKLGLPTSDELTVGSAKVSHFQNGSIYWTGDLGAKVLYGAFRDKYQALGGPAGFLGMPMQDQQTADPRLAGGDWCNLQGGTLVLAPNGQVYEVHGAILDKYYSLGGGYGLLGVPLSDEYQSSDGWRVSNFQYGTIMWRGDKGGAHLLFNRNDVVAALKRSERDGVLDAGEFSYFKTIANDANVYIPDWVRYLTQKVINGDKANYYSQGQYVNNLYAGAPARSVDLLEKEWFEGADRPLTNFVRTNSDGTWTTVNGGAYSAVAGPLFGANGPVYTDVYQGNLGDCYLLASLAETAYRDPTSIQNMFIDNGDGTFTVRFFQNSSPRYVTVDRQLPSGGGAFAQTTAGPIWVALAEKAYAQLNESGWLATSALGLNSYGAIESGKASYALAVVTGRSTAADTTDIDSAWAAGKSVILDTAATKLSYLVPNHSYAVVGYNATTKLYTLFNPWGVNGGTMPDGTHRQGVIYELASSIKSDFSNSVLTKSAATGGTATEAVRELAAITPAVQPRFVRGAGWTSRMWSTPLSA
ncbi:C2 family cysteine protease [Paludisphaera rhizosphaerae]|uniref:C2 family cysteine protease n=1 Tax=Paludisphaera rhizosphaerae TaxID=2711216 RepID=UPI0013EBFC63|nr:C2 family cysteine protease [Paludisphaera rhizosphaerae]